MPAKKMKPFHVGVAAEAFAAGLFAQAGFDVSVQYGANQPEYDLLVSRDDRFLKISVKGSQEGGWGLCQNHNGRLCARNNRADDRGESTPNRRSNVARSGPGSRRHSSVVVGSRFHGGR
jgi:hypothetical protein